MIFVAIILLVLNACLAGLTLYSSIKNKDAAVSESISSITALEARLNKATSDVNKRIDQAISIYNSNAKVLLTRLDHNDDEIAEITTRMDDCVKGIEAADKDVKEIRRYYVNYCSKGGVE